MFMDVYMYVYTSVSVLTRAISCQSNPSMELYDSIHTHHHGLEEGKMREKWGEIFRKEIRKNGKKLEEK